MKDLEFAVEIYDYENVGDKQSWRILQVFAHKVDAINFIIEGFFNYPIKISEVYGETRSF